MDEDYMAAVMFHNHNKLECQLAEKCSEVLITVALLIIMTEKPDEIALCGSS